MGSCELINRVIAGASTARRPRTYLTDAAAEEAIVRYGRGESVKSIAAHLGVNRTCVQGVVGRGRSRPRLAALRGANPRPNMGHSERIGVEPPPVQGARWIRLTCGEFALVDEADYSTVSRYVWFHSPSTGGNTAYAGCRKAGKLHRFVWSLHHPEVPPKLDHRDLNGLNCRLGNLRPATDQQNHGNRAVNKNSSTGFKGVSKSGPGYRAYIAIGRKQTHLGNFSTPEEAARAYDDAAVESFGEFARLNFPREGFPPAVRP